MKKFVFSVIVVVAAISATYYSGLPSKAKVGAITLANVEALTEIVEIGGKTYIIDEIPCASSAQEVRIDCSYINCGDCKSQAGRAIGFSGTCTNVREL